VASARWRLRTKRASTTFCKLRDADDPNGILVLLGGLEPIAVWGPLDPKVGHLALDHAGVGSQPPGWEHLEEDLASGFGVGVSERLRGKTRMGRRGPAGHPQGTDEAQPVWVGVGLEGDTVHQPADGVVHAQVPVELLADAIGHLGAQHHPRTALMGLEFVEAGLELPALCVGGGELVRGRGLGIGDGGDQSVAGIGLGSTGVVEGVFDDPDRNSMFAAAVVDGVDVAQVRISPSSTARCSPPTTFQRLREGRASPHRLRAPLRACCSTLRVEVHPSESRQPASPAQGALGRSLTYVVELMILST
jgi:hypothetical protein